MNVSVVVPVYNGEKFIEPCLGALANQTRLPDEVIVVDDGSTDRSAVLMEAKSIRVLHQSHRGPAAARNTGIQACSGELILFTDVDCEPHPAWVGEMINSFADPEICGVKGAYATRQPGIVPRLVQAEFEERYDLMESASAIDFIDTYSAGFRRQVLEQIGGFNPALIKNEDVDLSYRLARAGKKLSFNRKAIVFHHHPETWAAYFSTKAKKGYWRTIVYRLHPGKAIKDSYTPQILKLQIALALAAPVVLVFAFVWQAAAWLAVLLWGGLLISTIPFVRRAWRMDKTLAPWAVWFIVVRSYAFVVGVIAGMFGILFVRPGNR